ncbi:MAG: DUF2277 domain-containing protein [Candidatus Dormiibacterota bacterium]
MCRNITTLRGLVPAATKREIEEAARQFVRKVGGVHSTSPRTQEAVEKAVQAVAQATVDLLAELPPRNRPPLKSPPLRRLRS